MLAHWFATGLYCTGDGIDYNEPIAVPGGHIGPFKGNDPDFTDARIAGYVAALQPTAKTPYLFVPVGCDFQAPKPRLLDAEKKYVAVPSEHDALIGTSVRVVVPID